MLLQVCLGPEARWYHLLSQERILEKRRYAIQSGNTPALCSPVVTGGAASLPCTCLGQDAG